MFKNADRVKETSTTTGTGTYSLAGAVAGFQGFVAGIGNGNTCHYVAENGTDWEVGIGTVTDAAPDTLARTVILASSNAGAAVSWGAGTKNIFCGLPADFSRDQFRHRKPFAIQQGSSSGSSNNIMTSGTDALSTEGTIGEVAGDADGTRKSFTTAASIDADAGILHGSMDATRRAFNPDMTIKFKVTGSASRRVWIGWFEADHMASDSTAATHKFALRLSTSAADTGFCIVHSDGTTETVETAIQASDTGIHTIRLIADDANVRWGYSFDGAPITWITANIPSATQNLGFLIEIRTLEAVAKTLEFWWAEGSMDK